MSTTEEYKRLAVEQREAFMTAIVIGAGLGAAVVELSMRSQFIPAFGHAFPHDLREIFVFSAILYGAITIPRLKIRDALKTTIMTMYIGILLIYIPELTNNFTAVASVSFALLFINSIVIGATSTGEEAMLQAKKMLLKRDAKHLGIYGAVVAAIMALH